MAAQLTKLTHKIVIQLHIVAESCTICGSRSRRPVRKLLDTPSYGEGSSLITNLHLICGKKKNYQDKNIGIYILFSCICYNHCSNLLSFGDSSVGIALGYGLDERGSCVRFPAGARNFSLHHRVQNGAGAHQASYPMGTRGSFPGGKEAGA
jgi:hypothetical protein